jgi:hypothetical protein
MLACMWDVRAPLRLQCACLPEGGRKYLLGHTMPYRTEYWAVPCPMLFPTRSLLLFAGLCPVPFPHQSPRTRPAARSAKARITSLWPRQRPISGCI